MRGKDNGTGDIVKIVYGNDRFITNSIINNGLIVIGDNTVISGCSITSAHTGIQLISPGGSGLTPKQMAQDNYNKICDLSDVKNMQLFENNDITSMFQAWALSQPELLKDFLANVENAINDETMTRVME